MVFIYSAILTKLPAICSIAQYELASAEMEHEKRQQSGTSDPGTSDPPNSPPQTNWKFTSPDDGMESYGEVVFIGTGPANRIGGLSIYSYSAKFTWRSGELRVTILVALAHLRSLTTDSTEHQFEI